MMRLELHLFLWVTACLAVGVALFRGETSQLKIPSHDPQSEELLVLHAPEPEVSSSRFGRIFVGKHRGEPEAGSRLFQVIPFSANNDGAVSSASRSLHSVPILKGILEGDGVRRALFAIEGSTYWVASEGETVAGYVIRQIGGDRVVAIGADREPLTFTLRGAGERP